jgi:hypothetical protein
MYARWHKFEEKREAVLAIEAAVSPLTASLFSNFFQRLTDLLRLVKQFIAVL